MRTDGGAVTPGEKRIVAMAWREAGSKKCSSCGGKLKPVFTWHPMRPYYLTCEADCQQNA
jgi:ribosomal protein L34E